MGQSSLMPQLNIPACLQLSSVSSLQGACLRDERGIDPIGSINATSPLASLRLGNMTKEQHAYNIKKRFMVSLIHPPRLPAGLRLRQYLRSATRTRQASSSRGRVLKKDSVHSCIDLCKDEQLIGLRGLTSFRPHCHPPPHCINLFILDVQRFRSLLRQWFHDRIVTVIIASECLNGRASACHERVSVIGGASSVCPLRIACNKVDPSVIRSFISFTRSVRFVQTADKQIG